MKSKCSDKQRRANRENAKKSTGPKTPQGKARASMNALKHGILAKHVVASTQCAPESPHQFQTLLADLMGELNPRSLVEETLVERIATCYWRLSRAQRYESGAIRDLAGTVDPPGPELERLRRELQEAENALAIERRFDDLMNKLAAELSDDERKERDASFTNFVAIYELDGLQLEPAELRSRVRDMLPGIVGKLEHKVDRLADRRHSAEQRRNYQRTKSTLLGSLPEDNALLKVIRYETMLDRQLHRALDRLNRTQRARRRPKKKKRPCETNPLANPTREN